MLHAKFHDHRAISSVGKDFEGFYNIWVWWTSWSCDLNHLNWPNSFREKNP